MNNTKLKPAEFIVRFFALAGTVAFESTFSVLVFKIKTGTPIWCSCFDGGAELSQSELLLSSSIVSVFAPSL